MNIFFVRDDGSLVTPPLGGTILPGITRDSLIRLARADAIEVREERYAFDQWRADAASGRVVESFGLRHRRGGDADRRGPLARGRLHHRRRRRGPDGDAPQAAPDGHPARPRRRRVRLGAADRLMATLRSS